MKSAKLGVGVIGLGFMGRTHAQAFSSVPQSRLVAVADQDPAKLEDGGQSVTGNLGGESTGQIFDPASTMGFRSYEDMLLLPEIDLVSITTPTPTHVEIAMAAIEAGKHVLVEKPVDLRAEAIERLALAATAHGVTAIPAHCMRSWPAWSWMRDRVAERTFGDVRSARFVRAGAVPAWNGDFYRDDSKTGGAVVDLHIHDSDFIQFCFGVPESVRSTGTRRWIRTRYLYSDGLEVEAEGGWLESADAPFTMKAEIVCYEGTMRFDLDRRPELTLERPDGSIVEFPEVGKEETAYENQAKQVVKSLLYEHELPPATMDDAVQAARLIAAEIESMSAGGSLVRI